MKPNFTLASLLLAACLFLNIYNSFSQCTPPPVVPLYSPTRINITQNHTVTYTVSNAVSGYFYEVIDSATGQPLGQGVWALANGSLLLTAGPFLNLGVYTIYIRTSYLLGITPCTAVSANGTVTVNPSILPLELVQFKGKKQGNSILLEWETANEDRVARFEIERSEAGLVFNGIGNVAATGQANTHQHYTFTDAHPSGSINYYRLKMIDRDGKFTYSNILPFKAGGSITANVLPNPFMKAIILQVGLDKAQALHIRLIADAGNIVYTKEVKGLKGNNVILLNDLSALAAGSYFVQVRGTEDLIQQKVVKTNR